jgi:signal transduction histidine kinase
MIDSAMAVQQGRVAPGTSAPPPASRAFARSEDERLIAGVCGAVAVRTGIDPTLARLATVLLALAGGTGIVLYAAAWLVLPEAGAERAGRRARVEEAIGVALLLGAALVLLRSLGLLPADEVVGPAVLVTAGLALIWRRGERDVRIGITRAPVSALRVGFGLALLASGLALFLSQADGLAAARTALLAALALIAGAAALAGPFLYRLWTELSAERAERIRSQERAEVAARIHDSVMQTLALIQRESGDSRRVAALARGQERELRQALFGDPTSAGQTRLIGALQAAAVEIEGLHGVRIDVAHTGDADLDDSGRALVQAAREAMRNAAKFAGVEEIAVFAEVEDGRSAVFVRDRGSGFDRSAVPADRQGIAESIIGRLERVGGRAVVTSAPGAGTEVELVIERKRP